ncbi:hypothetical protein AK812_SmicGene37612 [Symbiodinium microadriaticum]|uniref:Reverse transcriptase domain-containing protein n=1 Tax=Symbiodinium microadriaticum TaxID=2951 RepID=A0A1Q9CFU6_SYMMI|nr:hypothetical protein AK812_SmicGene37612 [Symbiodinium microadriaticum]CAE7945535.1 unnamed protein product [Symbiodinium sp. KB8]
MRRNLDVQHLGIHVPTKSPKMQLVPGIGKEFRHYHPELSQPGLMPALCKDTTGALFRAKACPSPAPTLTSEQGMKPGSVILHPLPRPALASNVLAVHANISAARWSGCFTEHQAYALAQHAALNESAPRWEAVFAFLDTSSPCQHVSVSSTPSPRHFGPMPGSGCTTSRPGFGMLPVKNHPISLTLQSIPNPFGLATGTSPQSGDDLQAAWFLLQFRASPCANYVLRILPPHLTADYAAAHDAAVARYLAALVEHGDPSALVDCRPAPVAALGHRLGYTLARPTGSRDVFRRLVALVLVKDWTGTFERTTGPFQLALQTRAGMDALAACVRASFDANADAVVVSLDGRCAYDCMSRDALLGVLDDLYLITMRKRAREAGDTIANVVQEHRGITSNNGKTRAGSATSRYKISPRPGSRRLGEPTVQRGQCLLVLECRLTGACPTARPRQGPPSATSPSSCCLHRSDAKIGVRRAVNCSAARRWRHGSGSAAARLQRRLGCQPALDQVLALAEPAGQSV